jgi:import inner membrane translocase subunit TIM23
MATTKMQTPLSILRASAPLGRSIHTSVLHAARPSPALSSALVLSRHASSAASTSTTPTQSQTPQLTWDEFLKLRRTRRFINLGSSALSGMASIGVAVPAFAEFEIENIGAQMTGLDPMFIIGGSLMGVGAVGWLLGPFLGTTFFNIWKGSVRKEFARVCIPKPYTCSRGDLFTDRISITERQGFLLAHQEIPRRPCQLICQQSRSGLLRREDQQCR